MRRTSAQTRDARRDRLAQALRAGFIIAQRTLAIARLTDTLKGRFQKTGIRGRAHDGKFRQGQFALALQLIESGARVDHGITAGLAAPVQLRQALFLSRRQAQFFGLIQRPVGTEVVESALGFIAQARQFRRELALEIVARFFVDTEILVQFFDFIFARQQQIIDRERGELQRHPRNGLAGLHEDLPRIAGGVLGVDATLGEIWRQ